MIDSAAYAHSLQNPDEEIRCEVLDALLNKGLAGSLDLFRMALADSSPRVRSLAVTGLGRFGNPAVIDELMTAMGDSDSRVRAEAAYAAAQFREEKTIPSLLNVFSRADAFERVIVVMGIALFPHQEFTDVLLEALADEHDDLRRAARSALENNYEVYRIRNIGEERIRSETVARSYYEEMFRRIFDESDADGVAEVFSCIVSETDAIHRLRMIRALAELSEPGALLVLLQCADDRDEDVRQAVVGILGHYDDSLAHDAVEKALSDPSENVRIEAVFALGRQGGRAVVIQLVRQMQTENSEKVRETVLCKLAKLDYSAAESFLRKDLRSENKETRLRAAVLLAEQNDPLARDILWLSMDDADEWARALAVYGLGRLGDNTALAKLVDALQDSDPDVRVAAAESLGQLGDPMALPALRAALYDVYPEVRDAVADSLDRLESRLLLFSEGFMNPSP